ncbi:MAG: hypothetical protein V3V16_00605 [Melioribacteraceae bacterium]
MNIKSLVDCEKSKWEKIQLPNTYKKIGIGLAVFSFVLLFINASTINNIEYREIIKYGILVGLLITSISKEKIEDELITKLRMQAYSFAFIVGVIYTLVLPFIDFFVDLIIKADEASIKDMGDWNVLWILLSVQVLYFEKLKRTHK